MKVFKAWVDHCRYDEYDSVIVVAKDKEEALAIVNGTDYDVDIGETGYFNSSQGEIHIEEVDTTKKGVVCSSYNAG